MYIPKTLNGAWLHLLCRFPLLVVPMIIGLFFGLPHLTNIPLVPEAMVTFAFDDGCVTTYTKAFPILRKYNYVGTVFVITGFVDKPGYLSQKELLELAEQGWEIGSHTVTHPNLTELSDDQIIAELRDSRAFLERLGVNVYSFASPYGEYNERVLAIARQYYLCHRSSWPAGLNDIPLKEENHYQLKAVSVEADTTVEEVMEWITKAKQEHKWLILLFHHLDESGDYNWLSSDFETIVRFASEQGFEGVTMDILEQ